jgi:hypothetical protein
MYVGGEAIFSADLVEHMGAAEVRSIVVCRRGDSAVEAAIEVYRRIEVQTVTNDTSAPT